MELHLLGPIEATRRPADPARRQQAARPPGDARAPREPDRPDRASGRGPVGRRAAADGAQDGAALRLAAAPAARRQRGEIVTHGAATSCAWATASTRTTSSAVEAAVRRHPAREALALWRGDGARRRRRGAVRRRGDPPARGAAGARAPSGDRRDLAAGRHREVIGELDALVRAPAARAAARAADARAVSLRPPGRGARGVPPRARRAGRSIGVEPGPELRGCTRHPAPGSALDLPRARPAPASRAGGRWPRRTRAASLAASRWCSRSSPAPRVRHEPRDRPPTAFRESARTRVGVIDPDGRSRPSTRSAGPGGGRRRRRVGLGREHAGRHGVADRPRDAIEIVQIDVDGEPTALAFGAGALWVANGERAPWPRSTRLERVGERSRWATRRAGSPRGYGALWVTSAVDALVRRIDLAHRR